MASPCSTAAASRPRMSAGRGPERARRYASGNACTLGASQWRLESELGQNTRSFRAGYGYRLGNSLDLNLDAARHEPRGDEASGHEVQLRVGLRW